MSLHSKKWYPMAIGVVSVWVSACASSTPPPRDELTRADTAIKQAEQAGAAEAAPLELREAKKNYQEASQISGNDKDDYVRAQRLAERAIADAELAASLARAKRAETIAGEVREGVQTLQQELNRPGGGVQ